MPSNDDQTALIRPRAYSIPQAAAALGISRSSLYKLRSAGTIGFAKISTRTVVPASEVERILGDLERQANADRGEAAA